MSTCGTIEKFQPADEPGAGRAADARRIAKLEARLDECQTKHEDALVAERAADARRIAELEARLDTHNYQTKLIDVLEARIAELETKLMSQAREMTAARKRDEAIANLSPFDVFITALLSLLVLFEFHDYQARVMFIGILGIVYLARTMAVSNIREVFALERDGKPTSCDSWFHFEFGCQQKKA